MNGTGILGRREQVKTFSGLSLRNECEVIGSMAINTIALTVMHWQNLRTQIAEAPRSNVETDAERGTRQTLDHCHYYFIRFVGGKDKR